LAQLFDSPSFLTSSFLLTNIFTTLSIVYHLEALWSTSVNLMTPRLYAYPGFFEVF